MSTMPLCLRSALPLLLALAAAPALAAGPATMFRMHNNADRSVVVQTQRAADERWCGDGAATSTTLRARDSLPLACAEAADRLGWCVRVAPAPRWTFLRCAAANGSAPVDLNLHGR